MKSKPGRVLKNELEASDSQRVPIQNTALDWMTLAKETLPNATPLTPDERVSINEFFWSHFK